MTKPMVKDTFQYSNSCKQTNFKGLSFDEIARATIKSLDEDIIKFQAKEPHRIPALYLKKAELEFRSLQKKEAIKSLGNISRSIYDNIKNNPTDKLINYLEILKDKANLEIRMKLPNYAVRTLKTVVQLEPEDRLNHIKLINQQTGWANKKEVYKSYDEALKIFPDDIHFLDSKADFANQIKDFPETINTLNKMINVQPQNTKIYDLKADIEVSLKKFPEAINTLNEGIKANPQEINFYIRKAYLEQGGLQDSFAALNTIKEGIVANPKGIELYHVKVEMEINSEDLPAAVKTMDEGIKANPKEKSFYLKKIKLEDKIKINKINSFLDKAKLEFSQGKTSSAIKIISEGIDTYPDISLLYFSRGDYHLKEKNFDKAEKDFNTALEKNPGNALKSQLLFNKSLICDSKGDDETAVDFLEESLKTNAENELAIMAVYKKVGKYIIKEDIDAAKGILKRMVKVVPENTDMHFVKIHVNAATEDFEEALDGLQPLIENKKYSTHPVVLGYSAALHAQIGNNQEAIEELAKSRSYLKNNKARLFLLEREVNMVNGLEKFTIAKLEGKNVEFPLDAQELMSPKYEPKIKSKFGDPEIDDIIGPDIPLW